MRDLATKLKVVDKELEAATLEIYEEAQKHIEKEKAEKKISIIFYCNSEFTRLVCDLFDCASIQVEVNNSLQLCLFVPFQLSVFYFDISILPSKED